MSIHNRIWSCDEATAQAIVAASKSPSKSKSQTVPRRAGNIAVIPIEGPLAKKRGPIQESFGNLSVAELRDMVASAAHEQDVAGIMLHVSSGGGSTIGLSDLAQNIAAAAARKPVHAFIEDVGASGAFWLASQAARITANRSAIVGSIGTYFSVVDSAGLAGQMGLQVHMIRSGKHKGVGSFGTPIDDEQLEALQHICESINSIFVNDVSRGRRLTGSALDKVTDGRVFVGQEAKTVGLIDGIESYEQALAALNARVGGGGAPTSSFIPPAAQSAQPQPQPQQRTPLMREDPAEIVAEFELRTDALVQRTGCTKSEAAVRVAKSHPQLHARYLEVVNGRSVASASPAQTASAADVKAVDDEVDRRLQSLMASGMQRSKAVSVLFSRDKQLHQRYLQAHNPGRVIGQP